MIVAAMISAYVLLDGFDLGAGAVHLFIAKTDEEHRIILHAISPVWARNEVWPIASVGTLFFVFPVLYASSFSGFYLANDGLVAAYAPRHRSVFVDFALLMHRKRCQPD